MRPPAGIVEKTARRGVEPRSQTSLVFSGSVEYSRENQHLISSLTEPLQIKLRERLREDLGGTYAGTVGGSVEREPVASYSIQVSFAADPERLEELTTAVFDEIDKLMADGPANEDLAKAKESQRRSHETSREQNGFWMYQLLYADRYDTDPRDILMHSELIERLSCESLRDAAGQYLDTDNYVRVSLYPDRGI